MGIKHTCRLVAKRVLGDRLLGPVVGLHGDDVVSVSGEGDGALSRVEVHHLHPLVSDRQQHRRVVRGRGPQLQTNTALANVDRAAGNVYTHKNGKNGGGREKYIKKTKAKR